MSVSYIFVPLHRGCHISHPLYMAKILRTLAPVDSMSGMVGKRDETTSNKAFIINVKKVGGWKMKGAPFMYFSLRQNDRITKPSTAEIAGRERFAQAAKAASQRLMNPEFIQKDQHDFSKQDKYTSLYGYVFAVCYEQIGNE